MNAKELRIGNYVSNQTGELKGIPVGEYVTINLENIMWAELYVSVPLTEQWLINFGFEKHKKIYQIHIHPGCLFVNMYLGRAFIKYSRVSIDCKYVHQLQNIIYILTGKELTRMTE